MSEPTAEILFPQQIHAAGNGVERAYDMPVEHGCQNYSGGDNGFCYIEHRVPFIESKEYDHASEHADQKYKKQKVEFHSHGGGILVRDGYRIFPYAGIAPDAICRAAWQSATGFRRSTRARG